MPDYNSIAKEQWRRWVWNRVVERIPKVGQDGSRRSEALVLYLVGPEDKDREVATSKGFRSHNLIAVDVDKKCVDRVRQAKNLAICDRIEDLIAAWPEDWPIDAIVADFTCGLDNKTMKIFQAAVFVSRAVQFGRTVIAVNMQRGRDPDSNPVRKGIADAVAHPLRKVLLQQAATMMSPGFKEMANILTDQLHRGRQMLNVFLCHCHNSLKGHQYWQLDYPDRFMRATEPVFSSYRQNERMPYMDSVVFTMPPGQRGDYEEMLDAYMDMAKRDPRECRQKIAAMRAIRTMRLEGKLARNPDG